MYAAEITISLEIVISISRGILHGVGNHGRETEIDHHHLADFHQIDHHLGKERDNDL